MDISLTNFQLVYFEYVNGLIEESELPASVWSQLFNGEGRANPDYWPYLQDYWEEMKSIKYDPAFVQWMDNNVV